MQLIPLAQLQQLQNRGRKFDDCDKSLVKNNILWQACAVEILVFFMI